jgi:diaminohydroxyphosphoribosylaminopyrimidine deaminase/5-amino-6-(5-phosphoribosylamino)uracil reductase
MHLSCSTSVAPALASTPVQVGPDLMLCGYLPSSGGLMGLAQELGLAGDLPTSLSSDSLLSPPVTPAAAAAAVAGPGSNTGTAAGRGLGLGSSSGGATSSSSSGLIAGAGAGAGVTVSGAGMAEAAAELAHQLALDPSLLVSGAGPASSRTVPFYKAWDRWGALSNFSPHTVTLPHFHAGLMPASPQVWVGSCLLSGRLLQPSFENVVALADQVVAMLWF